MGRRTVAGGLALAMACGGVSALSSAPASAAKHPPTNKPAPKAVPRGTTKMITLITGDRVRLVTGADGKQSAEPFPGQGRERVSFTINRTGGDLSVIPSDALGPLVTEQLDKRLFNISMLVRFGYDDAKRKDIPLLRALPTGRSTAPAPAGSRTTATYSKIGIAATRTQKKDAGTFWRSIRPKNQRTLVASVPKLWLDGKARISLDQSVPRIGAPEAWKAGFTGKDVPVAILDTGLDATHPDFAGIVGASKDFSSSPNGTKDEIGHGTHVASTIAGGGQASSGKYKGVAPGAKLLIGKVCGSTECDDSAILAGMQWATDQHAKVVNLSLGSEEAGDNSDPLAEAVNKLTKSTGTLFVIASGNYGDFGTRVSSPASADEAFAVAAVTKQDEYASFSNPGPRIGDYALKPDISAPGVDIAAAHSADAPAMDPVGDKYERMTGTSMATPHIAGAAAVVAQQHPTWKAAEIRAALASSAKQVAAVSTYQQGAGRVDVARAVKQQVYATGSLSYGYFKYPHTGQQPVAKTLTYHNDGDAPVKLAVKTAVTNEKGAPAPADTFTLSAAEVTVPAKGTAPVTVTVDPSKAALGTYGGWVIATAGEVSVRTSAGAYVEPERYELKVTALGKNGQAAGTKGFAQVIDQATGVSQNAAFSADGVAKFRLAPGTLSAVATTYEGSDVAPTSVAFQAMPTLRVSKDTAVTMDSRQAKPNTVAVEDTGAELAARDVGWYLKASGKKPVEGSSVHTRAPISTGSVGASSAAFGYYDQSSWAQPDASITGVGPAGNRIDLSYLPTSPRRASTGKEQIVDGGTGSEADLSKVDVKGKVVLARPGDADEPAAIPAAVAKAGGKAAIIAGADYADYGPVPIPSYDVGIDGKLQPLLDAIAKGPATVTLAAVASGGYQYELINPKSGSVPVGGKYLAKKARLAHVHATYRAPGAGINHGMSSTFAILDGLQLTSSTLRVGLPSERHQYFTPGVKWRTSPSIGDFFDRAGATGFQYSQLRAYQAGEKVNEVWNTSVYAPRVSIPSPVRVGEPYFARAGDQIEGMIPMLSDSGATHLDGTYNPDQGSTKLTLDGKPVPGQAGSFPGSGSWKAPAADGTYQLTADISRASDYWPTSTKVNAVWTFKSSHVDGKAPKALPLLDVRYPLPVDSQNTVPVKTVVPLEIGHQVGSAATDIASVTAQVSYDDGKTWTAGTLTGAGKSWKLAVPGGKSGDFVSLRVKATDKAGNAVEETITKAYRLR